MEVLTFFSTNIDLINYFDDFLLNYQKIKLGAICEDTKYFKHHKTGRNEIYFHFFHNNIEHEFVRDYTKDEQEFIKNIFNNSLFYFFDIQYKDEKNIKYLLSEFKEYLKIVNYNNEQKILISHPFKGLLFFWGEGNG